MYPFGFNIMKTLVLLRYLFVDYNSFCFSFSYKQCSMMITYNLMFWGKYDLYVICHNHTLGEINCNIQLLF